MATHSPVSNGAGSPRYREKVEDEEEYEAHSKSNGSRNHHASRSPSASRSRSGSPADNKPSKPKAPVKQSNGRRSSRSPARDERKRRSLSREPDSDKHRERNGHGKKRERRSRSRSVDSRSPPRYARRSRSPGYRSSRSPYSGRGGRRNATSDSTPSRCVAVFGLSTYTRERELREIFSEYGPLEDVQVVYDKQSGRSRGFAFIYFRNVDDAVLARNRLTGQEIDGRYIRVDFSTTERAHSPTPGIYMGRVSASERERYRRGESFGYHGERSPPPRRRNRSRSRSPNSRSRSPSPPHRKRDY